MNIHGVFRKPLVILAPGLAAASGHPVGIGINPVPATAGDRSPEGGEILPAPLAGRVRTGGMREVPNGIWTQTPPPTPAPGLFET